MKKITFLIVGLFCLQFSNAQINGIIYNTNFNYQVISETEHHFKFYTGFANGSPGSCYNFAHEISMANDTLYVKAIYDVRGAWAAMGCSRADTAIFNQAIPEEIRYIKMSTNAITYQPGLVENVYFRVIDLDTNLETDTFTKVKLAPNPVRESFSIGDYNFTKACIFNGLGQCVGSFQKNEQRIYNVQELKSGLYHLTFYDTGGKKTASANFLKE